MSKEFRQLKKTVKIHRVDEESKKIADMAEHAVRKLFASYDREEKRDLAGSVQIGIVYSEDRYADKYGYYAVFFRAGGANHGSLYGECYYPNSTGLCTITIHVGLDDKKNHLDKGVNKEFRDRLVKEILGSIKGIEAESAKTKTLKAYIRDSKGAFSINWLYENAESIGIEDYGFVDKTLDSLVREGLVTRRGEGEETMFKSAF